MKHKHLTLVLAMLMSIVCNVVSAHSFEVDGIYYRITSSVEPLTVAVTFRGSSSSSYSNEYVGSISVPETVTYYGITYRVTSIGDEAFYKNTNLTSITIPNSVKTIGERTFQYCSGLASITIPNSVTTIDNKAFQFCSGLSTITIPSSVTSIGNEAVFAWCTNLESIAVDPANTVYDSGNNCNAIIEKSTSKLVAGCKNTIIPSDVKIIGNASFSGHGEISSINIPDGVVTIEPYAFDKTGLVSIELPNSIVTIENNAFEGCEKLLYVTLGNAVDTLGNEVFKDCSVLSLINIPEGVKEMGWGVFQHCTSLESIEIPSSISHLQGYTFCGCTSLKSVKLNEGTTIISRYAFAGCSSLEEITLPSTVKSIAMKGSTESCAFKDCTALKTVVLKNGLELIGTYTFEGCTSLESIDIPNSVHTIGEYSFEGCSGLTSAIIGNGVDTIGTDAFKNCSQLTSVTIPESVKVMGTGVFSRCNNLESVTILSDIPEIMNWTFQYCSSLSSVKLNEGLTNIGRYAFEGCTSLQKIKFPSTLRSIVDKKSANESSAFKDCTALKTVKLNNGFEYMGASTFEGCINLTSILLPNSVTYIGNYAFNGCDKLTVVKANMINPVDITETVFSNRNDATLYVPQGSKATYETANYWKEFKEIVESPLDSYIISDLTSKIQNSDFSSTEGWTAVVPGEYYALGNGLIGEYKVYGDNAATVDDNHLATEYCFGFECRWQTNYAAYTQTVKLPAGSYALSYDVENVNASTTKANYENRFTVTVGETVYTDLSVEWMNGKSSWTTHTIIFSLDEEADVTISLGYGTGSNNIGSANTPILYVSHLALAEVEELPADPYETALAVGEDGVNPPSNDNPCDATSLIKNASFDSGNIEGWTCTFKSGTNANNVSCQSATYTNGDIKISKFIEAWAGKAFNPNYTWAALGDGELSQTLANLPQGKYKFTCDAIATQQYESAVNPVTGVELFATGGELEQVKNIATGNFVPVHFEIPFVSTGGDITLGLRTKNTTANWIAADNFTLTYYGETTEDPAKVLLDFYIAELKAKYADSPFIKAQQTVKEAYNAALTAAEQATENYATKKTALENAVAALETSISQYAELESAINAMDKQIAMAKGDWTELAYQLSNLQNGFQTKYEEGTATSEEIVALPENIYNKCTSYISAALKANPESCIGKDVTLLLKNPGFDTEFSGWTVNKGNIVWGGENVGPLPTDHPAYPYTVDGIVDGGCAEKWHEAFDICQTIKNLPAGVFQLSCQAFERDEVGGGIQAELYAYIGENATAQTIKVKNINEDAQTTPLYDSTYGGGHGEAGTNNGDTQRDEGYVPNGMSGSNVYFRAGLYKNYFDIVVGMPSDMTVGIRTTSNNDWVLFDDFKLIYKGLSPYRISVDDLVMGTDSPETLEVNLYNTQTDLVAFQMDVTLPEGVSIDKTGCTLSSRIADEDQELTIGKLESGAYRLTSTSLSLSPISGKNGTLLTLKLVAAKGSVGGQATISNIRFSTANSIKVPMADVSFVVSTMYSLTYKVDGEEVKRDTLIYGTALTPEEEPTKEGYTFSGWSEIPTTMPAKDVVVTGAFYLYGDVNVDSEVDLLDAVDIARFVVGTPSEDFMEVLADLNMDNSVNVIDAVVLVNEIAGDQNFVKAEMSCRRSYDYEACGLELLGSGKNGLSFQLNGEADFTAFQFTMDVPEDMNITALKLDGQRRNGHQLMYNRMEDGSYRVVVLSLTNNVFRGSEGELLSISLDGQPSDDICIRDIHFGTVKGVDIVFGNLIYAGDTDGIESMRDGENEKSRKDIYDLQGRRRSTLQRGVNIVNGRKVIVK